jgi:hypothetical protein
MGKDQTARGKTRLGYWRRIASKGKSVLFVPGFASSRPGLRLPGGAFLGTRPEHSESSPPPPLRTRAIRREDDQCIVLGLQSTKDADE